MCCMSVLKFPVLLKIKLLRDTYITSSFIRIIMTFFFSRVNFQKGFDAFLQIKSFAQRVIEVKYHYASELQGIEFSLYKPRWGAPGPLTKWALVPVTVIPQLQEWCHSQSLSSHTDVLLAGGIWSRGARLACSRGLLWASRGGSNHQSNMRRHREQRVRIQGGSKMETCPQERIS